MKESLIRKIKQNKSLSVRLCIAIGGFAAMDWKISDTTMAPIVTINGVRFSVSMEQLQDLVVGSEVTLSEIID